MKTFYFRAVHVGSPHRSDWQRTGFIRAETKNDARDIFYETFVADYQLTELFSIEGFLGSDSIVSLN